MWPMSLAGTVVLISLQVRNGFAFHEHAFEDIEVVGEPSFVERPATVEKALGTTVVLRCHIQNLTIGANFVTWTRLQPSQKSLFVLASPYPSVPDRYSVLTPSPGEFHLQIRNLSRDDTGTYECTVTESTLSSVATVTALALPGEPRITQNKTSDLREGDYVEFVCASTGGHPAPDITWFRNGQPVSNMQFVSSDKPYGDSRSIVVIRLQRSDHERSVECRVSNKLSRQPLVRGRQLQVKYRPIVSISPSTPHRVLESAKDVTITCTVDANPKETQVQWLRRGSALPAESGGALRLEAVQQSDGGEYTCQASNEIGTQRATLQLIVLYQPKVSLPTSVEVNETESFSVECSVDASPEPDEVTWRWENSLQPVLQPGVTFSDDGRTVYFARASRSMAGRLVCEARNTLRLSGASGVSTGQGNDVTTVVVNYPPGVASIEDVPSVFTGSDIVLRCALADPGHPVAAYQWYQGQRSEPLNAGAELRIRSVGLQHEDEYTCKGRNLAGEGHSAKIHLVVNEYPKWDRPLLPSDSAERVDRSEPLVLSCTARAKPQPRIRWLKDDVLIDPADSRYFESQEKMEELPAGNFRVLSTLTFKGPARGGNQFVLRREDRGQYSCQVYHEQQVYSSKAQNYSLVVQFPPQTSSDSTRVAAALNSSVSFHCSAFANPRPTFSWFGPGGATLSDTSNLKLTESVLDRDEYKSTVRILRMQLSDKGTYVCRAQNPVGTNQVSVQVAGLDRPDTPSALRLATEEERHTTWESVTLSWTPGFDGGLSQTYALKVVFGGKERVLPVPAAAGSKYNVTDLQYSTTYQFSVQAVNSVGDSGFSNPLEARTNDFSLPPLADVHWDPKEGVVSFRLDYSGMCVQIEVKRGAQWEAEGPCNVPPLGSTERVRVSAQSGDDVRALVCLSRRTDICGQAVEAQKVQQDIPESTLIAIVVVCAVVVITLVVVLVLLCLRKRRIERKLQYKKQTEPARPKPMSAPPPIIANPQGFDNPAMERSESVDMDDPTSGGRFGPGFESEHRNHSAEPPSYSDWAKHTGSNVSYNTEAYEMENHANSIDEDEKKELHLSTGYDPYMLRESPRPVRLARTVSDSSRFSSDPNRIESTSFYSQKPDSSRSGESGQSSPNPKPKKVIYEVIV